VFDVTQGLLAHYYFFWSGWIYNRCVAGHLVALSHKVNSVRMEERK
jgi:hypothetical protein